MKRKKSKGPVASNPGEIHTIEGAEVLPLVAGNSPGEQIARAFAVVGFEPRRGGDYEKVYVDASTFARTLVTAVIDRGLSGIDPPHIRTFVITTQATVEPELEVLDEMVSCEPVNDMKALTRLINHAEKISAIDVITCEEPSCGKTTSEYTAVTGGRLLCLDCAQVVKTNMAEEDEENEAEDE